MQILSSIDRNNVIIILKYIYVAWEQAWGPEALNFSNKILDN